MKKKKPELTEATAKVNVEAEVIKTLGGHKLDKLVSKMMDGAARHKLQPIRYPSTRVYKINKGNKKGYYNLLPGTMPRRNGKFICFAMMLSNRKVKNAINSNWVGDYILIPVDVPKIEPLKAQSSL